MAFNEEHGIKDDMPETPEMETCDVPVAMLPNVKPGDVLSMKVESIDGETAKVSYLPEEESAPMGLEDMNKMSSDDAMKMPLADMEKKLPKVSEE